MDDNTYNDIKIVATFFVIFTHVTRFYSFGGGAIPMNHNFILNFVTQFIYSFHMPLFIFVSGAVYSLCINRIGKYKNIYCFVQNKVRRVILPYFVFGIFYVAPTMVLLGITKLSYLRYVYKGIILSMDARHLWFLWTLFFLFIMFRSVNQFLNGSKSFIAGMVLFIVSVYSGSMPFVLQFGNIVHYAFFFWLGFEFDKNKKIIDKFLIKYKYILVIGILFISFIILYTYNPWLNNITSCVGIVVAYQIILLINQKITRGRFYNNILNDIFGMYLFHPMIIYLFFYMIKGNEYNSYIVTILIFLISTVASYFLTEFIRKIKLGAIIGE